MMTEFGTLTTTSVAKMEHALVRTARIPVLKADVSKSLVSMRAARVPPVTKTIPQSATVVAEFALSKIATHVSVMAEAVINLDAILAHATAVVVIKVAAMCAHVKEVVATKAHVRTARVPVGAAIAVATEWTADARSASAVFAQTIHFRTESVAAAVRANPKSAFPRMYAQVDHLNALHAITEEHVKPLTKT